MASILKLKAPATRPAVAPRSFSRTTTVSTRAAFGRNKKSADAIEEMWKAQQEMLADRKSGRAIDIAFQRKKERKQEQERRRLEAQKGYDKPSDIEEAEKFQKQFLSNRRRFLGA